jgi:hypothetical protein
MSTAAAGFPTFFISLVALPWRESLRRLIAMSLDSPSFASQSELLFDILFSFFFLQIRATTQQFNARSRIIANKLITRMATKESCSRVLLLLVRRAETVVGTTDGDTVVFKTEDDDGKTDGCTLGTAASKGIGVAVGVPIGGIVDECVPVEDDVG